MPHSTYSAGLADIIQFFFFFVSAYLYGVKFSTSKQSNVGVTITTKSTTTTTATPKTTAATTTIITNNNNNNNNNNNKTFVYNASKDALVSFTDDGFVEIKT